MRAKEVGEIPQALGRLGGAGLKWGETEEVCRSADDEDLRPDSPWMEVGENSPQVRLILLRRERAERRSWSSPAAYVLNVQLVIGIEPHWHRPCLLLQATSSSPRRRPGSRSRGG